MRLPRLGRRRMEPSEREPSRGSVDGDLLQTVHAHTNGLQETVRHVQDELQAVSARVEQESQAFQALLEHGEKLASTNDTTESAAATAADATHRASAAVTDSHRTLGRSVEDIGALTEALTATEQQMNELEAALEDVDGAAETIATIARQTNLLAVNASIEAARSGSAGEGFAVVAEQIGTLAGETAEATRDIERTIQSLSASTQALVGRGRDGSDRAARVEEDSRHINGILETMEGAIASVRDESGRIRDAATAMEATCGEVDTGLRELQQEVDRSATDLDSTNQRLDELLRSAENLLNACNSTGAETPDRPFIEHAQRGAKAAGKALEQALAEGRLTESDLFDREYVPVSETNPQQYTTRFVAVTDDLFPPIQEAILEAHEKIISCCCTDDQGYIGTHNLHLSKPQRRDDPDWNRANSRHRQIYSDSVGQGAARNREPFLLQAYRRNMGERFVLTQDASAPIYVNGRHWGACRVIYLP